MKILLIVDVQNDFCPGGSLAVPDGDRIVPTINKLISSGQFDAVLATKDWHPANHLSFASQHKGQKVFDSIELGGIPQTLWPDHCVQGSLGAELRADLDIKNIDAIVVKGCNREVDSYSGFFDNKKGQATNLEAKIRELAKSAGNSTDSIELVVCGLATDYCVKATALDARNLGFNVSLVVDACRAISAQGEENAFRELAGAGVELIEAKSLNIESSLPQRRDIEMRV